MNIRAQIAMVLNLDKCIGCHTCSVTCKQVWTSREGVEYAWFNNVETKPGIGYPKDWENQDKWKGGWTRKRNGTIQPRMGAKWRILASIFANPHLPEIDDYYEPFTFDYSHLQTAPESETMAELARRHSDCPSRTEGGDLGRIAQGSTVPEFEAALRAMQPGQLSPDPVPTRYGLHVVLLHRHLPAAPAVYEAVAPLVARDLAQASWAAAVRQFITVLAARGRIEGFALDAEATGPLVQ